MFGQAFFRYDLVVSLLSSPGGFSNHQRRQLLRPNMTHVPPDTASAAGIHVDGVFSHLPVAPELFLSFESVKHHRITRITGVILHLNSSCSSSYTTGHLTTTCKNALIRVLAGCPAALLWAFFADGLFCLCVFGPCRIQWLCQPRQEMKMDALNRDSRTSVQFMISYVLAGGLTVEQSRAVDLQ